MDRLGPYELDSIVTGDARELAAAIPDESVDLIFTDPVYWQIEDYAWLAELGVRVLTDNGSVLAFCGNVQQVQAGAAMLPFLKPRPTLSSYMLPPYARLFNDKCHVNTMPLLWFSRNGAKPMQWITTQQTMSYHKKAWNHDWGKNASGVMYFVSRFTLPGAIILDPFSGGGTIPAVARSLGRHYLGFEINPASAELSRERVHNTQPPLFVPEPEQASMFA